MANYTDSLGFNKGAVAYPSLVSSISKIEVVVDFAKVKAARAEAGAPALAVGDTLQIMNVPAGSVVLSAGMNVLKAETVAPTAQLDIGYTGGTPAPANAYGDNLATNSVGLKAAALASPTVVTADDTIDILFAPTTAVPQNAVIKFFAFVGNAN